MVDIGVLTAVFSRPALPLMGTRRIAAVAGSCERAATIFTTAAVRMVREDATALQRVALG